MSPFSLAAVALHRSGDELDGLMVSSQIIKYREISTQGEVLMPHPGFVSLLAVFVHG